MPAEAAWQDLLVVLRASREQFSKKITIDYDRMLIRAYFCLDFLRKLRARFFSDYKDAAIF